jgi:hypothetical protein
MEQELFQPTLTSKNRRPPRSFNIVSLFYVAFFGGVIPLVVLGTLNALWLKVDKRITAALAVSGALILTGAVIGGTDNIMLFQGLTLILFMAYYQAMKSRYVRFEIFGGKPKSLWVIGVGVSFTGRLIEILLVGDA